MSPTVEPNVLVTTLLITMAPGEDGLPAHTHPGPAIVYVVKGEVLFQVHEKSTNKSEAFTIVSTLSFL